MTPTYIDRFTERQQQAFRDLELSKPERPATDPAEFGVYKPFSCRAWLPGDSVLDWRSWMQANALELLLAYEVARRDFIVPLPVNTAVRFKISVHIPGGTIPTGTFGRVTTNGVFIPLSDGSIIGNTWSLFDHNEKLTSVFDLVEPAE